jgi:predicted nucleic acid-binding protein
VKVLLSIDQKLLERIDRAARQLRLTRSAYLARLAERELGGDRGPGRDPRVRQEFEEGALVPVVPALLFIEVLNVAGRAWGSSRNDLVRLATRLQDMSFDVGDSDLVMVAEWVARGLTACDAVYVALAQARGLRLVTDDRKILTLARDLAVPLGA